MGGKKGVTRGSVHYGWVIVATGTLTILACLGLGRFALGMLLPSMGASLGLGYVEMGLIGTGNFVGYLAAVMVAGPLVRRFGARRTIFCALALVGASMMLVGRAAGFTEVLVLYVLTGIGTGAANVPVMGLVPHWFARRHRGKAAGWIVIGSGFGIIYAGTLVPAINAGAGGGDGWRTSWLVLGATALAIAAVVGGLLRNRPEDKGLEPIGGGEAAAGSAAFHAHPGPAARRRILAHLGAIYFLFGYTYVIYATFIVTTLVEERGFSEAGAGQFWAWIGFLSLASGPVFGTLSDRTSRRAGLIVVFALQMSAYLLVALPLPDAFLYLSIGLFGICAWSIPGIMAAACGDYMGAEHAVAGFGAITFIFGIGQIIGPTVAGAAADATGSFASSFLMAAAMAAAAIALSAFLRRPD
jgi:MFS family permease